MKVLLRIIYFCAFTPLLTGSSIFLYWYIRRHNYAIHVEIEGLAVLTLLGFLLFSLITLICVAVFLIQDRAQWKRMILPLLALPYTVLAITIIFEAYQHDQQKVFIRVINDTDYTVEKIWSDNFESGWRQDEKDFVISYEPVYTYDWETEFYSGQHPYSVNQVYMDLSKLSDSGPPVTCKLLPYEKGGCYTLRISKLLERK